MPASEPQPIILWFRRDLRLADNPALTAAVQDGAPIIAVYIRETDPDYALTTGAAADWFLHGALEALDASLRDRGAKLTVLSGKTEDCLDRVITGCGASALYFNRADLPWLDDRDRALVKRFEAKGLVCRSFKAVTLLRPDTVLNGSGKPFRVFSAFWRSVLKTCQFSSPLPAPAEIKGFTGDVSSAASPTALALQPTAPNWAEEMADIWTISEAGAHALLERFMDRALAAYPDDRDRPDRFGTSRLSPYLAAGLISPRQIWERLERGRLEGLPGQSVDKYLAEIGWREFAYYLFAHFGDLRRANFNAGFDAFPWRDDPEALKAWCRGQTGIPMVDAGMRELWRTGWMHNRVRMITASFLTKHLGLHWEHGMRWFEDTLIDGDPAVNAASWQWVAGSGADAAPYFRVFNPVSQGEKFDPSGEYVRQYVPELVGLRGAQVHKPFEATPFELASAGITPGTSYPQPVVGVKEGRERALEAYQVLKAARDADAATD